MIQTQWGGVYCREYVQIISINVRGCLEVEPQGDTAAEGLAALEEVIAHG